jgi:hypothetical protein
VGVLGDRDERAGPGQHRARRDDQHGQQPMAHPAGFARIRHHLPWTNGQVTGCVHSFGHPQADQPRCEDGNRDSAAAIAKIDEFAEADTKQSFGSLAVADITLRYSERLHCAWGLLSGKGEIYVLRTTAKYGNEQIVEKRRLTDDSITHTGAYDLSLGSIRVCGRSLDGSTSTGASVSSGADFGPEDVNVDSSSTVSVSQVQQLAGVQCTRKVP